MKLRVFALPLLLLAGAAQGGDLPKFDSERFCELMSRASGGSYEMKAGCMRREARSKEELRAAPSVPARIAQHCTRMATATGEGSYWLYRGCVRRELRAAGGR
jgi:hypothetical protein